MPGMRSSIACDRKTLVHIYGTNSGHQAQRPAGKIQLTEAFKFGGCWEDLVWLPRLEGLQQPNLLSQISECLKYCLIMFDVLSLWLGVLVTYCHLISLSTDMWSSVIFSFTLETCSNCVSRNQLQDIFQTPTKRKQSIHTDHWIAQFIQPLETPGPYSFMPVNHDQMQ